MISEFSASLKQLVFTLLFCFFLTTLLHTESNEFSILLGIHYKLQDPVLFSFCHELQKKKTNEAESKLNF
jgi:hypothetical protein